MLFYFAFGALAFYALMLGGWGSGSKYSFLGAMRSAAQLISYEIALGLSLLGVAIQAQSLSMTSIVQAQHNLWYIVPQFVGFLIFMIAGFAETNRPPFDLTEGDSEIVGGYNTEFGGMRFGSFFMAEYINMIVDRGDRHRRLPGRLARAGAEPPGPALDDPQDVLLHRLLHLGARHAAALPLRPAHVVRLEGAAAAGHDQRPRHRDPGGHMSPYDPGPDVIQVQRGPQPGGPGAVYRAFGETLRGLKTSFMRVVEGPVTIQYPEQKTPVYPRFRGKHKLHRFEDSGLEKCVGCSLCAAACPADCIRVVAAENTPDHHVSAGERYAAVYEINMTRCIFCGYCEVACPFDAITMGNDYELADYTRSDLIFTKEMLLEDHPERTPLRREGE